MTSQGPKGRIADTGIDRRPASWVDDEIAEGQLPDKRLDRRLHQVFDQMSGAMGQTIPRACQDWANTKAAYRFFSNARVSEHAILKGHFEATRERVAAAGGPILVLQDTTEFTNQREKPQLIGFTKSVNSGKDKAGRLRHHAVCGLLMHSSLAVTTQGVPLGLAAVKFWTRDTFKGTAALKRKINPTRVPIERDQGKLSLAGKSSPVQRPDRRAEPLRACRRPGERHLRTLLHRLEVGDLFPGAGPNRPARRRRGTHGCGGVGRRASAHGSCDRGL
jgi:hypothetical protein